MKITKHVLFQYNNVRLYKEASIIDPYPSSVSFDGMGTSIEASYGSLSEAVEAYREAHRLAPNSGVVLFHLAVALGKYTLDILRLSLFHSMSIFAH